MNGRIFKTLLAGFVLSIVATRGFAIEGLKLQIRCPDVVLSWSSAEGEIYIVQYRETLDTNTPWTTLTNTLAAEYGTNLTTFVHSNRVDCPEGQVFGMMMGGGGADSAMSLSVAWLSAEDRDTIRAAREVERLTALYELCQTLERDPHSWELENRPPYPWESAFSFESALDPKSGPAIVNLESDSPSSFDPQDGPPGPEGADGGEGGTNLATTGFYQVVRQGASIWALTNGTALSGIVTLRVEVGNDEGELYSVSLTESGSPIGRDSVLFAPFQRPVPEFVLDTTQLTNGVHLLSANASWRLASEEAFGTLPLLEHESPAIEVTVSNLISFPDWMPTFGQDYDSLLITAQSAETNANWFIDVYDSQDAYIGTFQGSTTDGTIGVVWNLIGPLSEHYDDDSFSFEVTVAYTDAQGQARSATATAPATTKNKDRWTGPGGWVIANQMAWEYVVGGDQFDLMTDDFLRMAEEFRLPVRPTHPSGEAFRIHYSNTYPASQRNSEWQAFRQALYHPNSRNLFYSGHGAPDGLGATTNIARFIPSSEIATNLATMPRGQTNRHGYRFVFLDGCSTAKGNLPEAFGIVQEEDLAADYYLASGERVSAFIGWNVEPAASFTQHAALVDHVRFVQNFLYLWSGQGQGVRDALNGAKNGPLGNSNINPKRLTVFGYRNLGVLQGNSN